MKRLALILIYCFSTVTLAKTKASTEMDKRTDLLHECFNNKKYLSKNYNIQCEMHYHHYNSEGAENYYSERNALQHGEIKIAEFNVLHPGMAKSRFKDYRKVAQILNEFDIIGVTELIPLVGRDITHNQALLEFKAKTPGIIKDLSKKITSLTFAIKNSKRSTVSKERTLYLLMQKKNRLEQDFKSIKKLKYRSPGYLKILDQLHKLKNGNEWSLILSPRGEGAATSPTAELVGYFYRSSIIMPTENDYCEQTQKWGNARPIACIVRMDEDDMGDDKREAFSRRPFMAEFMSGHFSFTLLTSHILFKSPSSPASIKFIMNKSFGVDTYEDLGTGMTKMKYARFAEVKMTLDFVKRYLKKYDQQQKDIIYMGDFNLEMKNPIWSKVLKSWDTARLYVSDKSSMSESKFNIHGQETNGKASNYDHFIFDPAETDECLQDQSHNDPTIGKVYDFTINKWSRYINRMYKIREEESHMGPLSYRQNFKKYQRLLERFVAPIRSGHRPTKTIGIIVFREGKETLSSKAIIQDKVYDQKYTRYYKERVLDSQLQNATYYSYFKHLISDHYPIYMSCSNRKPNSLKDLKM